jgi:hypothetical protein
MLLLAAAALVGCSGGGGSATQEQPGPQTVARVVVTPASANVDAGKTITLSAQAFDASGAALTRTFTWASSDTTKATVDDNGVVTGLAAGAVAITATADAVTSSPAALTITAPVSAPTRSSSELIDAAQASGVLNEETAIAYKVFAVFGDTRLPSAYKGDDSAQFESDVFDQINDRWEALSNATKETLEPFLIPPAYKGSWTSLATAGPGVLRTAPKDRARTLAAPGGDRAHPQSLSVPICAQPAIDPNWASVPATQDGHVRVWYDTRVAGMAAKAALALIELETRIWPTVVGTAGMKAPLSDATYTNCNGGDGRLDVYLTGGITVSAATAADLGDTWPIRTWATDNLPVFITVKTTLDDNELKGTLAHEFTHASQWAYNVAALRNASYQWLKESTAQAMIDVVYPTLPRGTTETPNCTTPHFEQCWAKPFMDTPDASLEDTSAAPKRMYGSYLFFQFLARTGSPSVIGQIWRMTEAESDQVLAVDKAVAGGFKQQWPKFAKLLWNQDPVNTNSFEGWDALTLTPALRGGSPLDVRVTAQGGGTQPLNGNIKHLASHYYEFRIADPNVRSLSFFNHIDAFLPAGSPTIATQAFIKKEGGIWEYEHWSDQPIEVDGVKAYCLDLTAERVADLVIVMSNFDPKKDVIDLPAQMQPRFSVSNVGCWRYKGSASVTASGKSPAWTSFSSSADGSVTFERYRTPQLPNGVPGKEMFQVVSGAITGSLNGINGAGCTVTERSNDNMAPGLGSGTLNVDLGLDIGTGLVSRAVSGSGSAAGQTHTVVACPNIPDSVSDGQDRWDWFELPSMSEMKVEVKPDGTIQGSFPRPISNGATGNETLIWNFTPLRQ